MHRERKRIYDGLTYLAQNRITLLRNNVMNMEAIGEDEKRLTSELEQMDAKLKAHQQTAQEMLVFVITFSELVKNACLYYQHALDTEKRDIASQVFYELTINNRKMACYKLKEGFSALFERHNWQTGSPS